MRRWRKLSFLLVLTLSAGAVLGSPGHLTASAASSTQQEIDRTEQERQEWEEKLDENQEEQEGLKKEQKTLKKKLKKLNAQLEEVAQNLEDLERQIQEKEQEITETQEALDEARETEKWQYECMITHVRYMYERREEGLIGSLLSESSFFKLLNAADYIEKVASYDRRLMDEYTGTRIFIEEEEARLQTEKTELDNLKVQVEAEKSKISGLISQTSSAIADNADEIEEAERQAEEYEAKIKEAEEDLVYLRKKLAAEIALSQAAANAKWRDISEVTFADGDRKLLANLIYCEAGGEPYEGKVAVGSVVINRVLSSKFPGTVLGVIYQKNQFSPAASGRLALALNADKATSDCYRAADEAMAGLTNVGNCVFFRTPIPGLTGISIGGHIFY